MFRWSGSKQDSARQSSERDQRQARRYIQKNVTNLNASIVSENFEDAEEEFLPNVDGAGDTSSVESGDTTPTEMSATAFEDEDKADDAEAWKKSISLRFQRDDPEFWFSQIEAQMVSNGTNLQWSKRNALLGKDILPEDVLEELKPLFRLSKAEAGTTPYKDIKTELLSIYGKKDEQAIAKAASRRLTTRPSALGKVLIHDICPGAKPFTNCHCARVVWYFFIQQMPQVIKTALAKQRFNKDTYRKVFQDADDVFLANNLTPESPAVAAVSLDETQPAIPYPVEAATFQSGNRGRGRGNGRGSRGRGQGRSTQPATKPNGGGQTQQNLPPNLCQIHKKYLKEAHHCRDPFVCEWAKFVKPKKPAKSE